MTSRHDCWPRSWRRGAPTKFAQERPTPLDEVRSGLIVFDESLWDAVPRYLRGVDGALRAATGCGCRSRRRR
jgi:phosphoenolpyruvate carboxylase